MNRNEQKKETDSLFYQVFAEGKRKYKHSSYERFGIVYKANFNTFQKAENKVNELINNSKVNRIIIYEVDRILGDTYRTGRQLSSGVYYTESRCVKYYSDSVKKEVYKWERNEVS